MVSPPPLVPPPSLPPLPPIVWTTAGKKGAWEVLSATPYITKWLESGAWGNLRSSPAMTTGLWYVEVGFSQNPTNNAFFGVVTADSNTATTSIVCDDPSADCYAIKFSPSGPETHKVKYSTSSDGEDLGDEITKSDRLRVLYDVDAGYIYFGKVSSTNACSWFGSGPTFSGISTGWQSDSAGRVFFVNLHSHQLMQVQFYQGGNALCPAAAP